MPARRRKSGGVGQKMQSYRVRRPGTSYTSTKAKRSSSQKYYPEPSQAKANRRGSAKAAASQRKKRGTQWRHGRKSKAEIKPTT